MDTLGKPGVGYLPLDTPKPVARDVFVVDSRLPGVIGAVLPVRMTVLRLRGGDLLLHSPTRFSQGLKAELKELGDIRHLVAPTLAHWIFLQAWQQACPDAITWAAPGLRERRQVRKNRVRLDHDLGDAAPPAWGDEIVTETVPGGMGFHEVALFHKPSRTLLLADLVVNLDAARLPWLARPLLRFCGMVGPGGMPPPYLRAVVKLRRKDAAEMAHRLLRLQPDRVIFAHGDWFSEDAPGALRRSFRWLIGAADSDGSGAA